VDRWRIPLIETPRIDFAPSPQEFLAFFTATDYNFAINIFAGSSPMFSLDRRQFTGGLAALMAAPTVLLGGDDTTVVAPFTPETLFLTWQGDPTTTMTVQWVGGKDATDDTTIYYQRAARGFFEAGPLAWNEAKSSAKAFPLTELTNFRAELTKLTPGTEYRMKIGKNSPVYKFRTMPAKATNDFTFISGGDAGVNQHVIENNKQAAKQDPYFAIVGGDLAYDNGTNAKTYLAWLRDYSKYMIDTKGRLIPMVVCIGNHEVKGGYNKTRAEAPFFFAHFDGLYKDTAYAALDFGDYLSLVLMDTGHVSKIAGDQTDWLDKALAARTERPHLIVVNHVPCYPSYRPAEAPAGSILRAGTGEEQRKNWVPLFEKHNVDLVLEHHDHTFKRTHPMKDGLKDKNGILYLGDGSWGKLRNASKAESRSYIAHASTSYHITVHRLEAEQRFHMALEEGGKIVDVCTTEKKIRRKG